MPDVNWFASHPALTIISHTILVAGVTWAASRFIFDENKLNWYRAIIENKDAQINNLKERLSFVEQENSKYLGWLSADSQTFPSLSNRIRELETVRQKAAETPTLPSSHRFPVIIEVKKNQAVVDESTEIVIALREVSDSRRALFAITLPGEEPQEFRDKAVGDVWRFERGGKKYRMTLLEVNFIASNAKLELRLDPDAV